MKVERLNANEFWWNMGGINMLGDKEERHMSWELIYAVMLKVYDSRKEE